MSNLLYKGYRKGCYNYYSNGVLTNYYYGAGWEMASYYADLQPNTTYTLKRFDSSTRFRIATYDTDVKYLYATKGTTGATLVQSWLKDSEDELTFTTGESDIYLVVYYTNQSQYTTRVMLCEGAEVPQEYEEPTEPLYPPTASGTTISDFVQGGFYVNNGNDVTNSVEIRSGLYRINPCKVAITCEEGVRWFYAVYNANFEFVSTTESTGYKTSGATIDISAYPAIRYIRIGLYNPDGISPPAECTIGCTYGFVFDESGGIVPASAPNIPGKPFQKPYPLGLWRIDSAVNDGLPYHELMPGLERIEINPVPQGEYICVFDLRTNQNDFETNGICVLTPTECKITEQLNGTYFVQLEHAMDEDGKWRTILEYNILKVKGQLFRIVRVDHSWRGNAGKVTAIAEHIFYQMNDAWIPEVCGVAGTDGEHLVSSALAWGDYHYEQGNVIYAFNGHSNIPDSDIPREVGENKWRVRSSGMTPVDFFLGSDGMISTFGGELYRNNFYFSIDQRMEGAEDNAFDLHVGLNLTGITRSVDASNVVTYYGGVDNYGNGFWVSWVPWLFERQFPHHVVRQKNYNYRENNMAVLIKDVQRDFGKNYAPIIGYRVALADARRNPDFAEVIGNPRYRVGDKGRIYDERVGGYVAQEITRTVYNAIKEEMEEVEFGSFVSFTRPDNYNPSRGQEVIINPVKAFAQLHDRNGKKLFDKNKIRLVKEVQI